MSDTPRVQALIDAGEPPSEFANLAAELERELTAGRAALAEAGMAVEDDASLPELIHALAHLRDIWHHKYHQLRKTA